MPPSARPSRSSSSPPSTSPCTTSSPTATPTSRRYFNSPVAQELSGAPLLTRRGVGGEDSPHRLEAYKPPPWTKSILSFYNKPMPYHGRSAPIKAPLALPASR